MLTTCFPNESSFFELLAFCEKYLAQNKEIPNPQQEALWILEAVFQKKFTKTKITVSKKEFNKLLKFLKKRSVQQIPLAYVLGNVPFGDLKINTTPPVLIPRIETEEWVSFLVSKLKTQLLSPKKILDLCTGSGCIGLLVAKSFSQSNVLGVDIDATAISLAKKNQRLNKIKNIVFKQGNLFKRIKDTYFDLIISNPPYISEKEYKTLSCDVKKWEAKSALVAKNNGFFFYEKIISQAKIFLKKNDNSEIQLALEIGHKQAINILKILEKYGFSGTIFQDTFGKDRAIFAKLKKE